MSNSAGANHSSSAVVAWDALPVLLDGQKATLRFSNDTFEALPNWPNVGNANPKLSTAVYHVLQARLQEHNILIWVVAKKKEHLNLVKVEVQIPEPTRENLERAETWVRSVMILAYPNGLTPRNFMILVNPASGVGKARTLFENRLRPILEAARCTFDVTYTTHCGHGRELATTLPLTYDAILSVSGDGMSFEVLNGFAERADARSALQKVAIVPIPAGSGNGFSCNLLGVKEGFDPVAAVLNAIKGKEMLMDLASVTTISTKKTVWSFLAQATGLMAELDLGTENMRWIGDTRFIIGFIRGLLNNTPRNIEIKIRKPQADKRLLMDAFLNDPSPCSTPQSVATPETPPGMPTLQFLDEADDGDDWVTFDRPITYSYGGLQPYVGRDLLEFPMKRPCDGLLHLVVQEIEAKTTLMKLIDNAAKGTPYFLNTHRYFTTQAYRVIPVGTPQKGRIYVGIDGEAFPYEPFHVEIHQGMFKTYSPNGKFATPEGFGKSEGLRFDEARQPQP